MEISKVIKIDNPEIIVVDKTKTGTVAHTSSKMKRKSLPKVSNVINFDDMPLGSPPKSGRKLIHGPNVSSDKKILCSSTCVSVIYAWKMIIARDEWREKMQKGRKKERRDLL